MRISRLLFSFLVAVTLSAPLYAQRLNLDLPDLANRAVESVDVTLDGQMLRLASKFLSSDDADERAVRDMVQKLSGIYVRTYEFDKAGEYDRDAVEAIRRQLGPSWKKIVNIKSRTKENVEIYTDTRGDAVTGLVVISAEPKELTLVNIVGPIDLDRLASLEGQFGIPHMSKESKERKGAGHD
jgi:hypothetical protein